jgi:hypothetical protein
MGGGWASIGKGSHLDTQVDTCGEGIICGEGINPLATWIAINPMDIDPPPHDA